MVNILLQYPQQIISYDTTNLKNAVKFCVPLDPFLLAQSHFQNLHVSKTITINLIQAIIKSFIFNFEF